MKTIRNPKLDKNHLKDIILRIPRTKVLVIGDLMLDEFVWGRVRRISPEAPVPVVNVTKQSYALGGAANVVNNLRALGCNSLVAGVIGDDETGQKVIDEFYRIGAKPVAVIIDKSRPTTLKTRVVAHSQQVVRIDWEIAGDLSENIQDKLVNTLS